MEKNEYRREFILLRQLSNQQGTGFVRLEKRTLKGSLQYTVAGCDRFPAGSVRGFLAMPKNSTNTWQVLDTGALLFDNRNQGGLLFEFDPRNVGGVPFDTWQAVGVLIRQGDGSLVILGNAINRGKPDWTAIQNAVAAPVAAPPPTPAQPTPPSQSMQTPESEQILESSLELVEEESLNKWASEEELPPEEEILGDTFAFPRDDSAQVMSASSADFESVRHLLQAPRRSARIQTEDDSKPIVFVGASLALKERVESAPTFEPFASPLPSDLEGFRFYRIDMPIESGVAYCGIGIKTLDHVAHTVCYAIPGAKALFPPPGLEGYTYEQGQDQGYWILFTDAMTGDNVAS